MLVAQSLAQQGKEKVEEKERLKVKRQEEEKEEEEEEEEERRMQRINEKVRLELPVTQEEREAWRRRIASSSSSFAVKRKKRRKRRLPKSSSRSSSGYGRPCDHQRRVPAVQEVRVHGASDSVHRRRLDILVVQQRQVRGFWYRKLWSFRSCSSSFAVDIPFVPQKLIPIVQSAQQIMEILQLLLILVVDVPVV